MVLGVGYVAEHSELEENIKSKGIYGIDEEHLLESFEVSMLTQQNNNGCVNDHIALGMDPSRIRKALSDSSAMDAFWIDNARFAALAHAARSSASGNNAASESGQTKLSSINSAAATPAEAVRLAGQYFTEKLSRLLGLNVADFEPDVMTVASYGLDSMIGAELHNWIFKELGLDVPFQQLLGDSLTISKFAAQVCENQGIVVG